MGRGEWGMGSCDYKVTAPLRAPHSPLPIPNSLSSCPLGVQRAKVAPDVFAVSARFFIRAGRRQAVISSGQIDEVHQTEKMRQKVIGRISDFRRNFHDDVFLEVASGEVNSERVQA